MKEIVSNYYDTYASFLGNKGKVILEWVYPKSCCLYVGYVLLAGLPVWPQWERMPPAPRRLEVPGWGDTQRDFHPLRKEGEGEGLWDGVTGREAVSRCKMSK